MEKKGTAATATADAEAAATWYAANSSSLSSKALFTGAVANGALTASDSKNEAIGRKNYWLLIDNEVDGDDHYIAVSTTTKGINITTSTLAVSGTWIASSQMSSFNVAPVPEPTSGLLMLLGMAGLALRRRRA